MPRSLALSRDESDPYPTCAPSHSLQGAVAILKAPGYCIPEFQSFDAICPRPSAVAYYDFYFYPDTDDDAIGEAGEGVSDDGGSSFFTTGTAEAGPGSEAMAGDDATSCLAHDTVSPPPPQARSPVVPSSLSGLQVIGTSSPASLDQQLRDPKAAASEPATGADGCPLQGEPDGFLSKGATSLSPPLIKDLQV